MTLTEHENYAEELLSNLADDHPEIESLSFKPDRTQSRNAAKAMTAILCHRLSKESGRPPMRIANTTYKWKEGIFNCRNIADRDYLWSNIRRSVAEKIHEFASNKPVAYLMAFSNRSGTTLSVWAIPEPLLNDSLSSLPLKKNGQEYTLQIFPKKQRIEHYAASPDLSPNFQEFPLSPQEQRVLSESHEVDASVKLEKKERAIARAEEVPDNDDVEGGPTTDFDTSALLATVAQQLSDAGAFDPSGIADARERALSSVVRRRGQPVFRQHLLVAYNGQCAITGCDVEAVLDAAHIVPYKGPETNHPGNGLLLRTDLHTLFDLKLIAIDVSTMSLLISPSLRGTCYEEYSGRPVMVPDDLSNRPSHEALEQHRKECGL